MRITVLAPGTRGDVQPYVALSLGLRAAGHRSVVATHRMFESFVRERGLEFAPLEGEPRVMLQAEAQRRAREAGDVIPWVGFMRRQIAPILQQAMRDALAACACADAIITNQLGLWVGYHVAERLRLPLVRAYTWPGGLLVRGPGQSSPDAERIDLAIGPLRLALGHSLNALLFSAGRRVIWRMFRPSINTARRQVLGLGPLPASEPFAELDRARQLLLYGFSEAVFEHPRGWGDWVRTTGYWFLDRDPEWQPPTALVSFLEAGPPPVFIGFGSMATKDPEHILRVAVDALADTGQRGVIAAGWADFRATTLPPTVLLLETLPFDWLFPRVAAVVHHGGAGTTAEGLRAGRPSVLAPHLADQPFWAGRIHRLQVGPRPIAWSRISAPRLAHAIHEATTNASMAERAARLGERIRAEDGVRNAVEAFERATR